MNQPEIRTQVIRVDARQPDEQLLQPAGLALRRGELVAFPTETVYGLGADALNPVAVARIFQVKGRPPDNPLIVHIADLALLEPLVLALSPIARVLFRTFSPGPLTLVMPRSASVPDIVTAGLETVAVRIPDHPVARCLLRLSGVAVAAPSANRSGRPSPTQAWHVLQDMDGRIPFLIDGGPCRYGLESTVVDVTGSQPVILRPGSITAAAIEEATGIEPLLVRAPGLSADGEHHAEQDAGPRAPGMKYRHYAPKAHVIIAGEPNQPDAAGRLAELVRFWMAQNKRVGVYACHKTVRQFGFDCRLSYPLMREAGGKSGICLDPLAPGTCCAMEYGPEPDPVLAGRALFDALRTLDAAACDVIIAEALTDSGIGAAYMNRLRKAARTGDKVDGHQEEIDS